MPQGKADREYIPALSFHWLTPLFDSIVALFTREHVWRRRFVELIDPQPGDCILDIGCGTGSTALALKRRCSEARVIGIDPDPRVLRTARRKAQSHQLEIELRVGYGESPPAVLSGMLFNKVVSSLVLHQVKLEQKRETLAVARSLLCNQGSLFIADFGRQRSRLMRQLFKIVQVCDGFEATQPNADGMLPELMTGAGFCDVRELESIPTPIGSISLYRASAG